ncbi:porin family protein [Sungkyunkwania multivorans]|uniref:Porin family protein n=1 Tax=Sungkyunkwania multivorans TaxID=1173618 RepID=A0ABW3CZE0_9FLAO
MKQTFAFALLFTMCTVAFSQRRDRIINLENIDKKPLSWGYFLGFNQYDFKIENNTTDSFQTAKTSGFNVGLVGEVRLHEHFDLRLEPGLYFTTRTIGFPFNPLFSSERDQIREVKSTYIHVPLLLKVSAKRYYNWKPFLVGGVSTSLNLSSNQDNPEDNDSGTFRMKKNTYYYEVGIGIDFYTHYFKFTPSVRGVFAINDELVRDNDPNSPWTSGIDALYTRGIFVNFTFE